jgi:hypothetical protein
VCVAFGGSCGVVVPFVDGVFDFGGADMMSRQPLPGPRPRAGRLPRLLYLGPVAAEVQNLLRHYRDIIDVHCADDMQQAFILLRQWQFRDVLVDQRDPTMSMDMVLPFLQSIGYPMRLTVVSTFQDVDQYAAIPREARVLSAPIKAAQLVRVLGLPPIAPVVEQAVPAKPQRPVQRAKPVMKKPRGPSRAVKIKTSFGAVNGFATKLILTSSAGVVRGLKTTARSVASVCGTAVRQAKTVKLPKIPLPQFGALLSSFKTVIVSNKLKARGMRIAAASAQPTRKASSVLRRKATKQSFAIPALAQFAPKYAIAACILTACLALSVIAGISLSGRDAADVQTAELYTQSTSARSENSNIEFELADIASRIEAEARNSISAEKLLSDAELQLEQAATTIREDLLLREQHMESLVDGLSLLQAAKDELALTLEGRKASKAEAKKLKLMTREIEQLEKQIASLEKSKAALLALRQAVTDGADMPDLAKAPSDLLLLTRHVSDALEAKNDAVLRIKAAMENTASLARDRKKLENDRNGESS